MKAKIRIEQEFKGYLEDTLFNDKKVMYLVEHVIEQVAEDYEGSLDTLINNLKYIFTHAISSDLPINVVKNDLVVYFKNKDYNGWCYIGKVRIKKMKDIGCVVQTFNR